MANEDFAYLERVRLLGCRAFGLSQCGGRVEAHHAGARGLGQRAHDRTAIPLCSWHHRAWHDARGPFADWDRARRRAWAEAEVAAVQAILGGTPGGVPW